jgi:hypothetical protein
MEHVLLLLTHRLLVLNTWIHQDCYWLEGPGALCCAVLYYYHLFFPRVVLDRWYRHNFIDWSILWKYKPIHKQKVN